MTIRIYPSLLPGTAIESHEHGETTLGAWLDSKGLDWRGVESQPLVAMVDDRVLPVGDWDLLVIQPDDDIALRVLPHGGLFKALGGILGGLLNLAFGFLLPGGAQASNRDSAGRGSQLEAAQGKANTVKLGEAVPELFGTHIRYPDYVTPPRRYFPSPRTQILEFHACIGRGYYEILPQNVKVGDTPFSALADNASYQVFEPGETITGNTVNSWHTVSEVGGTSSGTAGLELSTEQASRGNVDPASYVFGGDRITRLVGEFPSGWGAGTTVAVELPLTYNVNTFTEPPGESSPGYSVSQITGYFGHVSTSVGADMTLGPLASNTVYTIRSATPLGSGVFTIELNFRGTEDPVLLPAGAGQVLIFGADRVRTIESFEPQSIVVGPGGFGTQSAVARVIFTGGIVFGEWTSEFVATPGDLITTVLEFDVFFPNGLAYINDGGVLENQWVGIEFQYRDVNGGVTTTLSRSYTQATLDQIGFTEQFFIPPMRPAVRMRRISAESTSTQVQDKVHWYGMKSFISSKASYPGWTTMAVRLQSGGRLAAQSENQINVIATRRLPRLQSDGTWTAPVPTRDVASAMKYILSDIGYTDADIEMAELIRLNDLWVSRGENLDYVFDLSTVREALSVMLGAGMAEFTLQDGLVTPVRDDIRTTFENGQGYSPQNMTGPLRREFSAPKPGDFDGVEVEYMDPNTWTMNVVQCRLPGDQGFKVEKIRADGVTDRTRAWRIGMRRRRAMAYRRWRYQFGTELSGLNSGYLSYVPLFDETPGNGQSMLLKGIQAGSIGAILRVTEKPIWEGGESYYVAYRRPDGTVAGPFTAIPGDDEFSIGVDLPQPWPVVTLKMDPPHVYFGPSTRWCFPALIEEIQPQGNEGATLVATNYDLRVYTDDNNSPPTADLPLILIGETT